MTKPQSSISDFFSAIEQFHAFGQHTQVLQFPDPAVSIPVYVNEFWTARQRAANSLHEISYRACFKPQLPRFFIERLTQPGDVVYDPFMGRGTTVIEAALLNRIPYGCDINPLSNILTKPRLSPPTLPEIKDRLAVIAFDQPAELPADLLVFYHRDTLLALVNLRDYLLQKTWEHRLDKVDAWIRLVATNRLTGHSLGFFSVYTLPPNQAVSIASQIKINTRRQQTPPFRNVPEIILKKSKSLLAKLTPLEKHTLAQISSRGLLLTGSSDNTPSIPDQSVSLVVTSPPFLDIVNYQTDNWLRSWFNGLNATEVNVWQLKRPEEWQSRMQKVLIELNRVLIPGGHVAFEVGEVRGGKLLLETLVVPAAREAGLTPLLVMINDQTFTKTANCWGVKNLQKGTNTNRIVLLKKEGS